MAFALFSGKSNANHISYFDIRLDENYVVLRGNESEAASVQLKGRLILCLSEPLQVNHVTLTLSGKSKLSWAVGATTASGRRDIGREREFYQKQWSFVTPAKGKPETLAKANYEWPFDLVIPGDSPESVEGLPDSWVVYRFKADIGRSFLKDLHVRKPLRIIRTLDPSALELAHAMSVENVWPNKIEYSISTPSKAVMFGTFVHIDFRLTPLLKGLRIGFIQSQLIENHEFTTDLYSPIHKVHKTQRTIASDEHAISEEMQFDEFSETEGFQFARVLQVPKNLKECLQDCETQGLKIRHRLKFTVQLHNPDGHTSELRATLPVAVFISPNFRIDESNTLIDRTPLATESSVADFSQHAPPQYSEHHFDQLYSDVDPAAYMTPGVMTPAPRSGMNTPGARLSRRGSSENVGSMDSVADSNISASALQRRLRHLQEDDGPRFPASHPAAPGTMGVPQDHGDLTSPSLHENQPAPDYFNPDTEPSTGTASGAGTPLGSSATQTQQHSRRGSDEDHPSQPHSHTPSGANTPAVRYTEVEDLSRVPSYSTAVRTPVMPYLAHDLPNYALATSVPSSPPEPLPQMPNRAHLRGGGAAPASTPPGSRNLWHHGSDYDERRLRLIQARARA